MFYDLPKGKVGLFINGIFNSGLSTTYNAHQARYAQRKKVPIDNVIDFAWSPLILSQMVIVYFYTYNSNS